MATEIVTEEPHHLCVSVGAYNRNVVVKGEGHEGTTTTKMLRTHTLQGAGKRPQMFKERFVRHGVSKCRHPSDHRHGGHIWTDSETQG